MLSLDPEPPPRLMGKDKLDSYLDAVKHLPPTPTLLIQLIDLFRQPDRDVDEIVSLMRQDPSLTTEVLRRCNSSFFGNEEPVMDFNEAVFRLGFYETYRITVAMFALQTTEVAKINPGIDVDLLWRHSAITAITSGVIARELGESEGLAFTAGLLHDVGKIVLSSAEGANYVALLKQHGYSGHALNQAEKEQLGFCHGEVGARLLTRWGVPDLVSVPVLCHHQIIWPGHCERMAAIVYLANLMAHAIEANPSDQPSELPEADPALELLGLKPENLAALEQLSRKDLERMGSLLAASTG